LKHNYRSRQIFKVSIHLCYSDTFPNSPNKFTRPIWVCVWYGAGAYPIRHVAYQIILFPLTSGFGLQYVLNTSWYVSDTSWYISDHFRYAPIHLGYNLISFFSLFYSLLKKLSQIFFYNHWQSYKYISNSSKKIYHNKTNYFSILYKNLFYYYI
jgi:hypothetical protein